VRPGRPEVGDFLGAIGIEKNCLRFDIEGSDRSGMQVTHSIDDLAEDATPDGIPEAIG
jgi:hypothetical protein